METETELAQLMRGMQSTRSPNWDGQVESRNKPPSSNGPAGGDFFFRPLCHPPTPMNGPAAWDKIREPLAQILLRD
jgi:hypothetical protein